MRSRRRRTLAIIPVSKPEHGRPEVTQYETRFGDWAADPDWTRRSVFISQSVAGYSAGGYDLAILAVPADRLGRRPAARNSVLVDDRQAAAAQRSVGRRMGADFRDLHRGRHHVHRAQRSVLVPHRARLEAGGGEHGRKLRLYVRAGGKALREKLPHRYRKFSRQRQNHGDRRHRR